MQCYILTEKKWSFIYNSTESDGSKITSSKIHKRAGKETTFEVSNKKPIHLVLVTSVGEKFLLKLSIEFPDNPQAKL